MVMKIVVSDKKPKFLDTISYKEHLKKVDTIFQTVVMPQKEYANIVANNEAINWPFMKVL
jgi:hypothetical protein